MLLGELLIKKKLITRDDLDKALEHNKKTGFRLGHSLTELGIIDDKTIAEILSMQSGKECIVVRDMNLPPENSSKLSYDFCLKNKCIPLEIKNNRIKMAVVDIYDIELLDDICFLMGMEAIPQMATEYSIYKAIEKAFKGKTSSHEKLKKSDSHIVNLVNRIIFDAIDKGASDIHIENFESKAAVRYRIDGYLMPEEDPALKDIASVISRLKIMANLNIAEKRLPQDGRIIIREKDYNVDIRVSIIPAIYGENIVLRILDKKAGRFELNSLGLSQKDAEIIKQVIKKSFGLILITGPTGSGKTTTLYSMLKLLNDPRKKIITIEDPVEYKIDGVNQVEVNSQIGLTFASALRSFLRHDPDIMMVGEIRDKETAEIAIRASLTGHLVLSTIHTNDAPSAVTRLLDMGIEPFLLASTLELLISQRLVRTLCLKCKTKVKKGNTVVYSGKGCDECRKTGLKGRTGIFEILRINEKIQEVINKSSPAQKIKDAALKQGFHDLYSDGMDKVKKGITTREEILKVI